MSRRTFLRLEWAVSAALLATALAWSALRGVPLSSPWRASPGQLAAGIATGAALWLCIPLLRRSADMRRVWDAVLVPFSRKLSVGDVIVVAALSGITEELFFRGVLLAEVGLVASSVLFGVLHALNMVYAGWAALTGAGFGLLTLYSGSLAAAMAAHVTYNLGALLVLRRWPVPATMAGDADDPS